MVSATNRRSISVFVTMDGPFVAHNANMADTAGQAAQPFHDLVPAIGLNCGGMSLPTCHKRQLSKGRQS